MRRFPVLSSVLTLLLCLTGVVFGQETTGSIEVTVADVTGGRVAGATVRITGPGFDRTVTTDDQGFARILQVPPGVYTVTASATNFRSAEQGNVQVVLGKVTPVEFKLEAGGVQAQVVVQATEVLPIDPTGSKIQTNITARDAELLPKGVNFTTILKVAPAVRREPLASGLQIDGASGAENTFIIDGQEVTNFRTGQLNVNNNLPFQLIQEIQVKSNGFEAEFGGATGGVINVVTPSGGNDLHGQFGLQFDTSNLSVSGTYTDFGSGTLTGLQDTRPILIADPNKLTYFDPRGKTSWLNTFPSFSLGGPIVKNRIWFYTSFSPLFYSTKRTFTFQNGETVTFRQNERWDYGFAKLDGQVSDTLRLSGSYTYNPRRIHGNVPDFTTLVAAPSPLAIGEGFALPTGGTFSYANLGGRVPASNVNGNAVWTPTPRLVINVRAGRGYLNEKGSSYGIPRLTRVRCITGSPAGGCASGFSSIPTNFQTNKDISIRNTLDADASYLVSSFGGRHQFKFGYQLNKITNDVDEGYFDLGEVRLFYGRSFSGIGSRPGEIGYGYLQRFGTLGKAGSKNQSLFAQDSWQPFRRLTLNLGFRIEREDVPSFSPNGVPIIFDWLDKPAPRLGFAYDVLGDGRWKVFASYGWFYDRFKYELPRGSFGGDKFLRDYFPILASSPNFATYTRDYALRNSQLQLDFRVPSNSRDDNRIDPDLKAARQSEFTVGTERAIGRDLVFGARYTHKQIDRAIEDVGIFDAVGNELYFIANPGFGVTSKALLPGVPPTPKAERRYDALELRLDKRFARNYYFNTSYTYSRLFGNYSGLASSDERGRSSPNVNRFFDLPFLGFTADGKPDNGRLATDRPHVFKFAGGYTYNWFGRTNNSTELTGFFTAQSGTPLTTFWQFYSVDTAILYRRGDLGRTEAYTQTDLSLTHRYRFGSNEQYQVAFDVNVINLFNESNVLDKFTLLSPANFTATDLGISGGETGAIQAIFSGGLSSRVAALVNSGDARYAKDARYNQPLLFQPGRQIRFGFRFIF